MKTIGRTLIILVAALIVVSGLVAMSQAGWLSNLTGGFDREGGPGFQETGVQGQPPSGEGEFRPPFNDNDGAEIRGEGGFGERGERGGRGGLAGFGDLFKNLFIMGGIFAVVVAIAVGGGWLRKTLTRKPLPPTPTTGQTSA